MSLSLLQDGALCALDLLSVAGLLNYFGKTDLPTNDYALPAGNGPDGANGPMIDGITIKPVLLRKGRTKLGMYGIGNVKDTRMHFELMHNRVKMWKPKNAKEYCNLLLIHQNRYVRDLAILFHCCMMRLNTAGSFTT